MPRVLFNEKKINERISHGYGQGEGRDYKPWLVVGDFSSLGQCNRVLGITTRREHHFFSKLESNYFNHLDWCDEVVDIREQVPLFPVSETENIAQALGYKHPRDNKVKNNSVMTTDFLYSVKDARGISLHARSVKYWADLQNPRTLEKLSIERAYWLNRNVDFDVITEHCIDQEKCSSIRRFLDHYEFPISGIMDVKYKERYARILINRLIESEGRLSSVLHQIDDENQFPHGIMLSFFFHLVAHKEIPVLFEGKFISTNRIGTLIDIQRLKSNTLSEVLKYESSG
jgi:hypothetical protein